MGEFATNLYPKAALKMITHVTTALGVSGTSMYIHQPVSASAIPICDEKTSVVV